VYGRSEQWLKLSICCLGSDSKGEGFVELNGLLR
jgi:hypothetical protein